MLEHFSENRALAQLFAERASMSQRQFGERFKIGTAPMVWQYLQGNRRLNLKAACKFARGLGVDVGQFSPRLADELSEMVQFGGGGPQRSSDEYEQIRCVTILCRPDGRTHEVQPIGPLSSFIAFRRDWLRSKGFDGGELLAIQAIDNAMQTTFAEGDLLVINTVDRALRDGLVFAFSYEGQLRIRRVFRDAGSWWLHCDHPDGKRHPRTQLIEKHCYAIGRVVHRQSDTV